MLCDAAASLLAGALNIIPARYPAAEAEESKSCMSAGPTGLCFVSKIRSSFLSDDCPLLDDSSDLPWHPWQKLPRRGDWLAEPEYTQHLLIAWAGTSTKECVPTWILKFRPESSERDIFNIFLTYVVTFFWHFNWSDIRPSYLLNSRLYLIRRCKMIYLTGLTYIATSVWHIWHMTTIFRYSDM